MRLVVGGIVVVVTVDVVRLVVGGIVVVVTVEVVRLVVGGIVVVVPADVVRLVVGGIVVVVQSTLSHLSMLWSMLFSKDDIKMKSFGEAFDSKQALPRSLGVSI